MKKFLLGLALLTFVASCSNKQDKMLYNYVDNNTTSSINVSAKDLDFKVESIKKVKDVTVKDSLDILIPYLETKKETKIKDIKENIEADEELARVYKKGVDNGLDYYENSLKSTLETIDVLKKSLKAYETDFKGTFLEQTYNEIESYKKMKENDILSTIYDVSYSIKNPLMGNVKQTINKTLYTNRDNTKFIGAVESQEE